MVQAERDQEREQRSQHETGGQPTCGQQAVQAVQDAVRQNAGDGHDGEQQCAGHHRQHDGRRQYHVQNIRNDTSYLLFQHAHQPDAENNADQSSLAGEQPQQRQLGSDGDGAQ